MHAEVAKEQRYHAVRKFCVFLNLSDHIKLLDAMSDFRSYLHNRLRSHARELLLPEFSHIVSPSDFDTIKTKARETNVNFHRLLDRDPNRPTQWPLFPTILKSGLTRDDGEERMDMERVFQSEAIRKVRHLGLEYIDSC